MNKFSAESQQEIRNFFELMQHNRVKVNSRESIIDFMALVNIDLYDCEIDYILNKLQGV